MALTTSAASQYHGEARRLFSPLSLTYTGSCHADNAPGEGIMDTDMNRDSSGSQFQVEEAEWTKPENWRSGSIYFSRRDSRAFVPKRHPSMGVTVNFANPVGVGFLIGALLFAALIIYLASS